MNIRRAEEKDIPKILDLLSQVLELHAALRPDYFIPGTTKYTAEELKTMIGNDMDAGVCLVVAVILIVLFLMARADRRDSEAVENMLDWWAKDGNTESR